MRQDTVEDSFPGWQMKVTENLGTTSEVPNITRYYLDLNCHMIFDPNTNYFGLFNLRCED